MQKQVQHFFEWANNAYDKIFYVMGNHEFYDGELNRGVQVLRDTFHAMELRNIQVLENDIIELDDVFLFGSTLWTSCSKGNPIVMSAIQSSMADYKKIGFINEQGERIRITPEFTMDVHQESMRALKDFLQQPTTKKRVVITHHAPHIESIEPCYRRYLSTDAFYEELFDLIIDSDVSTWIHGHTHYVSDYSIGNTRVLANPRGYYGSENTSIFRVKTFDPAVQIA